MKTPDYVLSEKYTYSNGADTITLDKGMFVRPIKQDYLPRHILADKTWQPYLRSPSYVFCYTRYGIIPVTKNIVERV